MKAPKLDVMLASRLSVMFFLQFFIFGSWYVTVGNYMDAIGLSDLIHWAYTIGPISALISPFLLGRIADRFFPTEKVLGILNLLGAVAMVAASSVDGESGGLFIFLLLLHTICFFPTLGLASTLAFHQINNPEKEFPVIRAFGSVGWIMAGVLVSAILHADETVLPLRISAGASFLMGLYCFTLPHTPPSAKASGSGLRDILGLDALKMLKNKAFITFILCELLISIPLSTYYAYAPVYINAVGVSNPAFTMSFGQMTEVAIMFFMPIVLIRLGIKKMIVIGFVAWVLRFFLFAGSAPEGIYWMILVGILLHGICFDFVYIAGQIFIDRQVTPDMRGQAQGLLVMVRSGIGLMLGAQLSGWLFNNLLDSDPMQIQAWPTFWLIPAIMALLVLIGFAVFFQEKPKVT